MNIDRTLLHRFFEGSASQKEKEAVRQWLESAADNKSVLLRERKLFDAMLLFSPEKKAIEKHGRKMWIELMKVAAVVTLVLLGNYYYRQHELSGQDELFQTMQVPSGQRINLTLPDGTNVWLNALSKIKYPVTFNRKNRTVILDGEAYFKVAENREKPFIVKTLNYQVKVCGTEFNVEAYENQESFKTTLMSGRVEITSAQNPAEAIVLEPKQVACLVEGKLQITRESNFNSLSWTQGIISFRNTSFPEMMKTFEKYFGVEIQIENEQVKNQCYTGKFYLNDQLNYVLNVLQKDIPFSYEFRSEGKSILIQ